MGQERGKLPGSSNSPAKGPDNTKVSTLISTLAASADTRQAKMVSHWPGLTLRFTS